jgi:hypothetical protein
MPGWSFRKRPKQIDESLTSLTFTDVIFGLVFTEIFIRAAALRALPAALDVHLALALAVAAGSYIGYRGSLKRGTYKLAFFNLPLLRFVLDLVMIFLYYVLAVTPPGIKSPSSLVHPRTDSFVVLLIFVAYLAWDAVSWWMAKAGYDAIVFQPLRMRVTMFGVLAAVVVLVLALVVRPPLGQHLAITVDSLLIGIVILYRWLKDSSPRKESEPAERPDPSPVPHDGEDIHVSVVVADLNQTGS